MREKWEYMFQDLPEEELELPIRWRNNRKVPPPTIKTVLEAQKKAKEKIKKEKAPKKQRNHYAPEERAEIYAAMRRKNARETQQTLLFSLSKKKDAEIIEHIQKQPNKCEYLRQLVRKDIKEQALLKEQKNSG